MVPTEGRRDGEGDIAARAGARSWLRDIVLCAALLPVQGNRGLTGDDRALSQPFQTSTFRRRPRLFRGFRKYRAVRQYWNGVHSRACGRSGRDPPPVSSLVEAWRVGVHRCSEQRIVAPALWARSRDAAGSRGTITGGP